MLELYHEFVQFTNDHISLLILFEGMFLTYWRMKTRCIPADDAQHRTVSKFFQSLVPDDFSEDRWYVLFVKQLKAHHMYARFVTRNYVSLKKRSALWVMCFGRLANAMFVNTILNVVVIDENRICSSFTRESKCTYARSINTRDSFCVWTPVDDDGGGFCSYNDHGSATSVALIITFLIVIFCIPLDKIVDILVEYCILHTPTRERSEGGGSAGGKDIIFDDDLSPNYVSQVVLFRQSLHEGAVVDELRNLQTLPSKCMLAARLVKMQLNIGNATTMEELEKLIKEADQLTPSIQNTHIFRRLKVLSYIVKSRNNVLSELNADLESANKRTMKPIMISSKDSKLTEAELKVEIAKAIVDAHMSGLNMIHSLRDFPSDNDRENYLMKRFVISSLNGFYRVIAPRYLLPDHKISSYFEYSNILLRKWLSMVGIVCYFIGILFYVFLYGGGFVGSGHTRIWLGALLCFVLMDILLLQPALVFFNFVCLVYAVQSRVMQVLRTIQVRVKSLLRRKRGVLVNTSELIQHLNPACRAAREYPHLMVSRLLISMNDYDFPIPATSRSTSGWYMIWHLYDGFVKAFLTLLTCFPYVIQDILISIIITGSISFFIVLISTLNAVGIAVTVIVLAIALASAMAMYELVRRRIAESSIGKGRRIYRKEEESAIMEAKIINKVKVKRMSRRLSSMHQPGSPMAVAVQAVGGKEVDLDKPIPSTYVVKETDFPNEKVMKNITEENKKNNNNNNKNHIDTNTNNHNHINMNNDNDIKDFDQVEDVSIEIASSPVPRTPKSFLGMEDFAQVVPDSEEQYKPTQNVIVTEVFCDEDHHGSPAAADVADGDSIRNSAVFPAPSPEPGSRGRGNSSGIRGPPLNVDVWRRPHSAFLYGMSVDEAYGSPSHSRAASPIRRNDHAEERARQYRVDAVTLEDTLESEMDDAHIDRKMFTPARGPLGDRILQRTAGHERDSSFVLEDFHP